MKSFVIYPISIYKISEYPFSRALIGYSSSGYSLDIHWFAKHKERALESPPFQSNFEQIKFIFCRWLFTGLVYTDTVIHLHFGE